MAHCSLQEPFSFEVIKVEFPSEMAQTVSPEVSSQKLNRIEMLKRSLPMFVLVILILIIIAVVVYQYIKKKAKR